MTRVMPCAVLTAALAALAIGGCGGSGTDKAGGERASKPTVLTLANTNGDSVGLEPFANAVEKRSGGTLQIAFKNRWRPGQAAAEAGLIHDVKAGKADLGWAGTRAFDDVGVPAFDALHAPLLIDSLPLERAVLESPLASAMLGELKPAGLVGLGVLPGPLRRPLGVAQLVTPRDYAGKTIALGRSQVGTQTLAALGAQGASLPATGSIEGYDGVEQQLDSIAGNGYDNVASHLTANVALWPRPVVLFANPQALSSLSERQRDALAGAAKVAFAPTFALLQKGEDEAAATLCRRGVTFETAGKADLAALRRAVQPVYARLGERAETKAAIAKIEALRADAGTAPAPACGKAAAAAGTAGTQASAGRSRTAIDGVWVMNASRDQVAKAMIERQKITRAMAESDLVSENYGRWRFAFDRGRLYYTQAAKGSKRWTRATYTVKDHTFTVTVTDYGGESPHGSAEKPGESYSFHWSRYRDRLTLTPVKGAISPENFSAQPWRKVG